MEKDRLHVLFNRYLERKCSPDEIRELISYFKVDAGSSELKDLIESELSKSVSPEVQSIKMKSVLDRVGEKLNIHIASEEEAVSRSVPFYKKHLVGLAVAASLTALLIVASFYRDAIENIINPVHFNELRTGLSERRLIKLTDGSKAWLSPGSTLNYPDVFRGGTREVSVSGQVFFEVEHDVDHPFIVRSGKLQTQVLGTSFNVVAYENEKDIEVTLLEGKVRVSLDSENIDINPNERVVYSQVNGNLRKEDDPDAQRFLEHRLGVLEYKGTPLLTVVKDMERTFGIRIELDEELSNCLFIGSFKSTDSPELAIQQLVLSFNAKYKQLQNKTYSITGRACR